MVCGARKFTVKENESQAYSIITVCKYYDENEKWHATINATPLVVVGGLLAF